jgi:hypothetical protein
MGIDDESSHPKDCVQKLQTVSHGTSSVFSESRKREICLSGSMSGNRKQGHRQTGLRRARRKPRPIATGRLKPMRLFSTLLAITLVDGKSNS